MPLANKIAPFLNELYLQNTLMQKSDFLDVDAD